MQAPKLQGPFPVNARYPSMYYIFIELHLFIITIIYCNYSIFYNDYPQDKTIVLIFTNDDFIVGGGGAGMMGT